MANPNENEAFSADCLLLDTEEETRRIALAIEEQVLRTLKRKGAIVGLSGGVDSSVVASLLMRGLGKERVLGLLMPEADSSEETLDLSRRMAEHLGIRTVLEDITPLLEACGCYRRRDDAIRLVVPEFGPRYKCKLVLPGLLTGDSYRVFSIVVRSPEGKETKARLTPEAYRGVVAATNFKQRTRKMLEYYHADRLQYAVAGTPNRLEYDQGFFVKNGDGAADLKPIAHLYKTQVYQLGEHLGVPGEILRRPPTTDTYSLEQTQDEFFFSVPYRTLDLCLYGKNHGVPPGQVAAVCGLPPEHVERVYADIDSKRRATQYQHTRPLLVEKISEIDSSHLEP